MHKSIHERFLTVETGEIYQPVRLVYSIVDKDNLIQKLNYLQCLEHQTANNLWTWYWKGESSELNFAVNHSFKNNNKFPVRLGTLNIKNKNLYIYLPSFKRACIAVPFFHRTFTQSLCMIQTADFINKIFTTAETLPRNFNEIFDDKKLEKSHNKNLRLYQEIEEQCKGSLTRDEAIGLMDDVIKNEEHWQLPFVERYQFDLSQESDCNVIFMAFYLFMRSRELVVINQALGKTNYQLSDAAKDTITQALGHHAQDNEHIPLFYRAQAIFKGYIKPQSVNIIC